MTPLAQQTVRMALEHAGEPFAKTVTDLMSDIHCFEATEVLPFVGIFNDFVKSLDDPEEAYRGRVFLPAPKTWIEFRLPNRSERTGILLEEVPGEQKAKVYLNFRFGGAEIGWISTEDATWYRCGGRVAVPDDQKLAVETYFTYAHMILAIINTPRIIGRKQHMPHAGLERKLLKARKWVGKFPLHAWTEIKLRVTKPITIDDGEPHEAHLTGRRALHFCRAHLRLRNGRLEYVSSHWRGDPAVGIKQSRYRLVA